MTFVLALLIALGDIAAAKAEPDLGKRSELALANADRAIDDARKAYTDGDDKAIRAALDELSESADVAYDALQHAHGAPRNSKYYKHAELKLRAMTRRLNGFRDQVNFDARQPVETVIKKLSDIHDRVLADIMSKKK